MAKHSSENEVRGPLSERVAGLSTPQLIKEIAGQGSLLIKKQIELAKSELKSDARTEAKVAGGLGVAAVCAIITVTLLLVTVVLALAQVLPGWAAGLIVSGFMLIVVAATAGISWSRRIRKPLQRSRRGVQQDIRFTKERFA